MAIYCFKCPQCGAQVDTTTREAYYCGACARESELSNMVAMVRDYRREAVGIGAGVRVSRDGTVADQAKLFLPDNSDYAGPGDPDGTKGMKAWHEQFEPKGSRPAQTPGRIERTVF